MILDYQKIELRMATANPPMTQGDLARAYARPQSFLCKILSKIKAGEDVSPVTCARLARALKTKPVALLLNSKS